LATFFREVMWCVRIKALYKHCIAFLSDMGCSPRTTTLVSLTYWFDTSGNDLGNARSSATSAELDSTTSSSLDVKAGSPQKRTDRTRLFNCMAKKRVNSFLQNRPPAWIFCGATSDRNPCAGVFSLAKSRVATMAFPHAKWP
jgi:hypothetical protein